MTDYNNLSVFLLIIGGMGVLFSSFSLFDFIRIHRVIRESLHWEHVNGVIVKTKIIHESSGATYDGNYREKKYSPVVEYKYTVKNLQYFNYNICVNAYSPFKSTEKKVSEYLTTNNYNVNEFVKVYFDKNNPHNSLLKVGYCIENIECKASSKWKVIAGIYLIIFAVILDVFIIN